MQLAHEISLDERWRGQDVWLFSCNTGLRSILDGKIFAQELANILCRTVKAPIEDIYFKWDMLPSGEIINGFVKGADGEKEVDWREFKNR